MLAQVANPIAAGKTGRMKQNASGASETHRYPLKLQWMTIRIRTAWYQPLHPLYYPLSYALSVKFC